VSYLPAVGLLVAGLLILVLVLRRLARAAGRLDSARRQVNIEVADATGLLRARTAALRIAVRQRRRTGAVDS
jgi:hypothetical protein